MKLKIVRDILRTFVICLSFPIFTYAQSIKDTIFIKSLDEDWLVYNIAYSTYVPVANNELLKHQIWHQWIDGSKYGQYQLLIKLPPRTSLFVNNLLIDRNSTALPLIKLFALRQLIADHGERFFVSIYNIHQNGSKPIINIVYLGNSNFSKNLAHNKQSEFNPRIRRPNNSHQSSIMIFILAILIISSIKNTEKEVAASFFGFKNIISNHLLEDSQLNQIWRLSILAIIFLTALLLAFLMQYALQSQIIFNYVFQFFNFSFQNTFIKAIILSFGFFFLFIIRYAFLNLLSWFFKQNHLIKIHYFDSIKLLLKLLIVISLLYFIMDFLDLTTPFVMAIWLRWLLIIILLGLLINNLYITTKITHFRNVYLFSYLCISEILPTLFLVKFLLN